MRPLSPTRPRSRAFTLIELLIVIAIIALLAALLFPAFAAARANARKATCMSGMKQIAVAVLMYTQDYDEKNPRTQETNYCQSANSCIPSYNSWWASQYYQTCLEPYMGAGRGGMSSVGGAQNKRQSVWYDPSDPDIDSDPYIWGSFRNNGLVTGVDSGGIPNITNASTTILMVLRVENWAGYEVQTGSLVDNNGNPVAMPPANAPPPATDPFWQSDYFDICLNPWSYASDPNDLNDPYYWAKGKAAPPCDSNVPGVPTSGDGSCINEYRSIDGNWPAQNRAPRYGAGQPYAFVDGHVKMMPFAQTYQSTTNNMWSTKQ